MALLAHSNRGNSARQGPCPSAASCGKWHLDLRKVFSGTPAKDHPRSLEIHLSRAQQGLHPSLLRRSEDSLIPSPQLRIGPPVNERQTTHLRQPPNRNPLDGNLFANRETRFEIRVIVLVLRVIVEAERLPGNISPHHSPQL